MNQKDIKQYIKVDRMTLYLRKRVADLQSKRVLIANLSASIQAQDIHSINCNGFGRIWHKSLEPIEGWNEVPVPHYPASWKLGISVEQASYIQVFQIAGCNYRCWFCYVDYHLLTAKQEEAQFFSADELVSLWQREPIRPRIIRLSGGEPDIVPEWTPWMIEALVKADVDRDTYLWVDDNLSGYYAWEFLTEKDWDIILNYPNLGRIGTIKGIDPISFHYNTGAPPEHFLRQIDILKRWVKLGVDQYAYIILTTPTLDNAVDKVERLLDLLQGIHPYFPLRVFPQRIELYSPTVLRLSQKRMQAIKNQFAVLKIWNEAVERRFNSYLRSQPCYAIDLSPPQRD